MRASARALIVLTPFAALSCSKGCKRERPYTPYSIHESQEDASGPSVTVEPAVSAPVQAFIHVAGGAPAEDGGAFLADRLRIDAPPGEHFAVALASDLDGDRVGDVVAWSTGNEPLSGRLLFYRGRSAEAVEPPRPLAVLAAGSIGIPGCAAEPRLEQIGPHTVAVTVRAACSSVLDGSVKSRWIAVATPVTEPSLREEARVGEPPPGENLRIEWDAADQDGDGRDDLVVRWTLDGGPPGFEASPPVAANLRFYDRPAGLSRDPQEPEASLRGAAAALAGRASKKAEAAQVFSAAREIERLHAILCADEGVSLVSLVSGQARCGLSRALEDVVAARVRAAITLGDIPRAIAASSRAGFRPATTQRRAELEKAIAKAIPIKTPVTHLASVSPDIEPNGVPGWGPLTFTPANDLLVRTRQGLAIIAVPAGTETATDTVPRWPSAVTNPESTVRWLGIFDACDGAALHARFGAANEPAFAVPATVARGREFFVPILAPAPSRCVPDGLRADLDPIPVSWGASGLEAWIAGELVLLNPTQSQAKLLGSDTNLGQPVHAGGPRSPDGRSMALATPLGALVRGPGNGWQLWRPSDLEGARAYSGMRGCAAANDARFVACVRDGRVLILMPTP